MQQRTKDQVHVPLPGVLLGEGDEQGFGELFCNILGIKELLWLTFSLRILLIACFIDLRKFYH